MYPGNPKAAENELFRRAKIYMGQLTDGESDQAWSDLVKLYRLSGTRNGYINRMRSEMGVKVLDEIKIGKRTFTLASGFTIEQVASHELIKRPISGDFDSLGRLYLTESSGSNENVQIQLKKNRIA